MKREVWHVVECLDYGTGESVRQLITAMQPCIPQRLYYDLRTDDAIIEALKETGCELHHMPMKGARRLAEAVARLVKDARACDVRVVFHGHSSYGGAVARIAAVVSRATVIYSPRGFSFLRKDISLSARRLAWCAEWILAGLTDVIVACGAQELRLAQSLTKRVLQIQNGVDVEALQKIASQAIKGGVFTVVGCGRISPQKGFDYFVEVALQLPDVQFRWIGGYEGSRVCEIPGNVALLGKLEHSETLRELAAAHVFVSCSRWEGLSRVLLECLALGLPVVVSDIEANRQALTSERSSNGVACRSVDDYALAIRFFADSPDALHRAGEASLRHAIENFNSHDLFLKWLHLYTGGLAASDGAVVTEVSFLGGHGEADDRN